MRPGKKTKQPPSRDGGIDAWLIVQTALGTLAMILVAVWFGRALIWQDDAHARCIDLNSKTRALLRVQSDLLDEAMREIGGIRDSLALKAVETRAISVRELLTSERDKAAFDDFLVSIARDVEDINNDDEMVRGIAHRPRLKEAVTRIKRNIAAVLGPDFFKGKVTLVPVNPAQLQEEEEEVEQEKKPQAKVTVITQIVDEDDMNEEGEERGDGKKPAGAFKPAPLKKSSKKTTKKSGKGK